VLSYIRLLSAELEYPGQFPAGEVLVGYASTQFPQFPLTPPEADVFVSGELWAEALGRSSYCCIDGDYAGTAHKCSWPPASLFCHALVQLITCQGTR
jgi:hypothetical protein